MSRRLIGKRPLAALCAACMTACGAASANGAWDTGARLGGGSFAVSSGPIELLGLAGPAGMNLGMWRDYTRQALLPDFFASMSLPVTVDIGLLAAHEHLLLPGFMQDWQEPLSATRLTLDFAAGFVGSSPLARNLEVNWFGGAENGTAIDRMLVAPGLSRELGDGSFVDVAAVFATQRYATWGLGSQISDRTVESSRQYEESSAGTGLRLGFNSELAPGITVGAAYQSRINMDAFHQYRGVYSEPGDFDIPATANLGLVLTAGEESSISVEIQRVLYSEINAFTAAGLPDRFLSLLGDSGSPEFNWRDLTIYRVGWSWQPDEDWDWRVQYSTRQQPSPTSELLSRALEPEIADSNVSFGFSRRTWHNGRLDFAASYAPSEYFLGPANLGRSIEPGEDQFEVELRLIWDF